MSEPSAGTVGTFGLYEKVSIHLCKYESVLEQLTLCHNYIFVIDDLYGVYAEFIFPRRAAHTPQQ